MRPYNPQKIEKKWQRMWRKSEIYKTPDRKRGKKNFYHLVMFPYPSGDLHIGHWYNFAPADVYARYKRLQGFNVVSPMGFDAFGLPAENAAIRHGIHPQTWTYGNIKRMKKQLRSIGACYDWSREIVTCDPEYYKWTQWMFLKFYKAGLAYRAKVPCNFCSSCKTVLADEQVVEGRCERCDSKVIQKEIEQWLFKITHFTEDLLKGLEDLDWPETTKMMQRNWIGKSSGWNIQFKIKNSKSKILVFTTRIDTLFGSTYLVLSPEHPLIQNLKSKIQNLKFIEKYIEQSGKKTEKERISEMKEKTGIKIEGITAVNPVNGREIPIYVADYVLGYYGTGAIMAVPAHDNRDWEFAKKYNLPMVKVISGGRPGKAYEGEGTLINSGKFTGMKSIIAKERIGKYLVKKGLSERKIYYRLRDWLISRQRYWGAPIPMINCPKCGWQPVKEKDLPVLLPRIRDYRPAEEGESPLARSKRFVKAVCPKCKGPARKETDTMDTFVCSSWYFLRYADPNRSTKFASERKLKLWLPVDIYIGGTEHAYLHLLYSRFFTKALKKMKELRFSEPFLSLRHQGTILGSNGQKMSKSRGNVIDPDQQIKKYGSDAVRMYLCFMGPYSQGGPWQPKGILGVYRFLNKVWELINSELKTKNLRFSTVRTQERLLHKTIKKVTQDIENFKFNTAISALMILVNEFQKTRQGINRDFLRCLLLLLAPFVPHLTEELWSKLGENKSIHNQKWPRYNPRLIKEEKIQLIVQINGRVRDKVQALPADISEKEAKSLVLQREKVKKWLCDQEIKKIIFIPGKLINIVV